MGTDPKVGATSMVASGLKVGGTLAGYRLVKKLGEGGMGMVFAAEDIRLKRRVALKLMKPDVAAKEQHRQRFLLEAQAAAAVEHDHIVPIFQIGEDNGIPFFAMPFLKGEPLDVRLKRLRLSIPEIIAIARQTAEGLTAAHENGLIHRDIKPGNIWLETTSDGGHRVKILDFGLARMSSENRQHLTQSGAVMGTPAYMAPEQARGRPVDHRADLFSLGCILYEMTTARRPFTGSDTMAILTALALDTPPDPITINRAVPPQLSKLIMHLLEKDPARRPATAREVAEEIRRLQPENMLVVVAPAAPVEDANPWADIDAESMTEVPMAEPAPDSSLMTLGPDSSVESTPSAARSGARSASRKSDPPRVPESRSGHSSRSLNRMNRARVSGRAKFVIGGGLLAIALIVTLLIIVAKNNRDHQDSGSKDPDKNLIPPPAGPVEDFALEFDGKSSFVEVPNLQFLGGAYTLEAFITPAAEQGPNGLVVGQFRNGGIVLEHCGDCWQGVVVSSTGSTNIRSAAATAQAGKRVHVAFVWNGTAGSLFVDGKKSPSTASKLSPAFTNPGTTIGAYLKLDGVLDRPFTGVLDEIRVSKVARYDKDFAPQNRFEPDRNTLALYHCDEGFGTELKDSSPNRNHGKVSGAKWIKPENAAKQVNSKGPPKSNHGLAFDGKSSYVLLSGPSRDDPGPLTIEAWVRNASNGPLLCLHGRSAVQVFFREGLFCAAHWTPEGILAHDLGSARAIASPNWVHVAYVYDGSEGRIYVGGLLSKALKGKIDIVTEAPLFPQSQIGADVVVKEKTSGRFLTGEFRELRISNSVRYNKDFTPDSRFVADINTLALYHCDEGAGDTLKDSSAGGNDGTILGAKWIKVDEPSTTSAPTIQ